MAKIDDLLEEIGGATLRAELRGAVKELRNSRNFGLVFEEHIPEEVALPGLHVRQGSIVQIRTRPSDTTKYEVLSVGRATATITPVAAGDEPYTLRGVTRPMYPDLLVFRQDGPVVVDLLDPHDPSRDEAAPKAAGLASYVGHLFGRVRLIAEIDGDYRQLDLKDPKTRNAVKAATTSNELKRLYTTVGAAGLT
ncbi:MAG TPA: hypothetical protein VLB85_14440 [Acidimicrobiia bacterium]|nr:hypothetical protein [Acidimicrobiia bacterium]